ncbi:MAG: pseudaminic acid cytidylyltransferase, partial [Planctomycetales bacterium]|nr:pseudaminic acid cytidylyltransferase [Planctomycetales bacterium]
MNLAVIPARGGSKRIPGKNIRDFLGRPAIAYSIAAAQESGVFDRIIVSTDSPEVTAVARELGAEVPFVRPAELSDDHTPTIPVIAHAIDWQESTGATVDFACCIYATAPFVQAADLRSGLERLRADPSLEFAFPITTFPFPIFRALSVEDGVVRMFYPEHVSTRSQDLPEAWHDAGQFYWGTANAWRTSRGIFTSRAAGIPLPRCRVQDLDTLEDWK